MTYGLKASSCDPLTRQVSISCQKFDYRGYLVNDVYLVGKTAKPCHFEFIF